MKVPLAWPPQSKPRAFGDRIPDEAENAVCRLAPDQRTQGGLALARIAGHERHRVTGQPGRERVGHDGVHHDPLRRHADLALVQEGAERCGPHRLVEVGVVQHQHGGLAAEFEDGRLEMARRGLGHDPADPCRTGEVDAPHGTVGDQRFHDLGEHRPGRC